MNTNERYIVESLTDVELDEDEEQFINFWLLADHQEMNEQDHSKLINIYEKYIGLGYENKELPNSE